MSTILKALRRLERERSKDVARPLREEVVFSRPRSRGRPRTWGWIGAALLLGFVATWAALPPSSPRGTATAPPAAAPPALAAALAPAPAALPPVAARGATADLSGPVVAPPRAEPAQPAAPSPPVGFVAPRDEPSRTAAIAPPREPAPSIPRAAARETTIDDELVVTAPIEGRASRSVDEEPAPRRAAIGIPVRVVRTSWHPHPDRRAAWVAIGGADAREVREGEWVGALEIRTIEPDGILFADGPLLVHRSIGER
jgi:hypothetical protein